ncbi:GntR family transcriptional regulator [Streptomyces sp. NPDC018007]|uniref:GntR family transcriptional regulator n=1 Tax=Streptomyces sp. NPDC018007 TaxID=3365029 RepID=UPI0037B9D981
MSHQANPRGTFLEIADAVKAQIEANESMTELPTAAEIVREYGVSRGLALRVFQVLEKQGVAERVPGGRFRVIRQGEYMDRRPLAERLVEVIVDDRLAVGEAFPSTSKLCERFGVSRPTVTKALDKMQTAGLLSEGKQGKQRTVLALPDCKESAKP